MANTKSFRGYTGLGNERTAAKADERETFWAGLHEILDSSELPVWYNLVGPNQWPAETSAVGFRKSVEAYLAEIEHLSERFTGLVAEALDTDPSVFAKFFKKPCMSGMKIAAYPAPDASQGTKTEFQGVGPHKDGSFLTYLLQGTEHSSLEVQNKSGEWIAAPQYQAH
ncbi:Clavaminate synthase-like protein [Penicillium canescens]|uniref:Clavaminate synthase-like protein n=1 Tax=Penicillium canescens TaxID=5083 RepID=UPI0026DFF03A|nr:Clavaminate synthase-like protein [Penicillium canescens]KAJ5991618.1 Clavaminate synthase-like protein [Penicillium canescens]KAJ6049129.1 Clavaminate synthase-like protein [Penicillium canescens]KAJ6063425.1 Clavaminate synthase-like protein [Penicillium canescens]